MQVIYISEDRFQYDIHSLFKAFYPTDTVRMIIGKRTTLTFKVLSLQS